jgi:glycosyltransferase involved in cell wall biosynthesis
MRVTLYTDAVELGGAELSLCHLAAALDANFHVTVLGVDETIVEAVAARRPGAERALVRGQTGPLDIRALAAHAQALRRQRPDILHCNLMSPWSCQYAIAASVVIPATRVVAVYQLPVPPANELQRRLKRLTSLRVAAHVGVGRRTAREVEAFVPLRQGSVRTVHNGVPATTARPRASARSTRGPTVGTVGRLERQKAIDVLLTALSRLPGVPLRIVGDGSARTELEALADRLGVSDRVTWVGWSRDIADELQAIDVYVQASRFEGFPLAILEAMLAGLPVVATDVGSVSEVVETGATGFLVPPEDPDSLARAIGGLLVDPDARERLGRKGRERVLESFTADAMAAAYGSLYRELIG